MNTPVLLLIFNRSAQALQVLEAIRQQQPAQLFIAADGPRENKPGETELCHATRDAVLHHIDWPCEVKTLFRPRNLGCGKAVSSAISWFFEEVEEGIILEDDCLPDSSFFTFCSELLERYRLDEKIMHIGGSNYQMGIERGDASYYFSKYAHIWGWASWRRAWKYYDFTLQRYSQHDSTHFIPRFQHDLRIIYEQKIDTWDIQWFMSVLFNDGIAITPNTNLIRNTGFGQDATHTATPPVWFKRMVYNSLKEISHPLTIRTDQAADAFTVRTLFNDSQLSIAMKKIIKSNALLYNLYKRIS